MLVVVELLWFFFFVCFLEKMRGSSVNFRFFIFWNEFELGFRL